MIMNERGIKRLEKLEKVIAEWTEEWADACANCRMHAVNHSPEVLQAAYFDMKYGRGASIMENYHKDEIKVLEQLGFEFIFTFSGKNTGRHFTVILPKGDVIDE